MDRDIQEELFMIPSERLIYHTETLSKAVCLPPG